MKKNTLEKDLKKIKEYHEQQINQLRNKYKNQEITEKQFEIESKKLEKKLKEYIIKAEKSAPKFW